jgi:acyl carrier protein
MDELIEKLREQIIEQLNLVEVKTTDIDPNAPLFAEDGLGLDSIDALEFIVLLETHYGIKIKDPSEGREIFYSVTTLADYIKRNRV